MHNTENILSTEISNVVRKVDKLGRGYGTGRAKNDAISRVWISFGKSIAHTATKKKATDSKHSSSHMTDAHNAPHVNVKINNQDLMSYFKNEALLFVALQPIYSLHNLPLHTTFNIDCTVAGSGLASQAKALSLGIARGLVVLNPEFKEALRAAGLLTRGPIGKEREKYGRRGARADLPYKRR